MSNRTMATILVVDDTPDNLKLMNGLLKDIYRVKIANGGERALSLADADLPDLILLDIMMPGMDGYEVCRRLKANPRTRDIPVIFLTAKAETQDEELGFEVGAVDYIQKPISPPIVLARVKTHLALRAAVVDAIAARNEADKLLNCLLPEEAAEEIRLIGTVMPRRHDNVAVLFCDVVSFTRYCDQHEPEDVVSRLDSLFCAFEQVTEAHGMEKIKTIGDAFMSAASLLKPMDDPLTSAVDCGLAMVRAAEATGLGWEVRIGIHVGPLVAGVVGQQRYQFDIWGDTVNMAARMAGKGGPGRVAVTDEIFGRIKDRYTGTALGELDVKGKGAIPVYEVTGKSAS